MRNIANKVKLGMTQNEFTSSFSEEIEENEPPHILQAKIEARRLTEGSYIDLKRDLNVIDIDTKPHTRFRKMTDELDEFLKPVAVAKPEKNINYRKYRPLTSPSGKKTNITSSRDASKKSQKFSYSRSVSTEKIFKNILSEEDLDLQKKTKMIPNLTPRQIHDDLIYQSKVSELKRHVIDDERMNDIISMSERFELEYLGSDEYQKQRKYLSNNKTLNRSFNKKKKTKKKKKDNSLCTPPKNNKKNEFERLSKTPNPYETEREKRVKGVSEYNSVRNKTERNSLFSSVVAYNRRCERNKKQEETNKLLSEIGGRNKEFSISFNGEFGKRKRGNIINSLSGLEEKKRWKLSTDKNVHIQTEHNYQNQKKGKKNGITKVMSVMDLVDGSVELEVIDDKNGKKGRKSMRSVYDEEDKKAITKHSTKSQERYQRKKNVVYKQYLNRLIKENERDKSLSKTRKYEDIIQKLENELENTKFEYGLMVKENKSLKEVMQKKEEEIESLRFTVSIINSKIAKMSERELKTEGRLRKFEKLEPILSELKNNFSFSSPKEVINRMSRLEKNSKDGYTQLLLVQKQKNTMEREMGKKIKDMEVEINKTTKELREEIKNLRTKNSRIRSKENGLKSQVEELEKYKSKYLDVQSVLLNLWKQLNDRLIVDLDDNETKKKKRNERNKKILLYNIPNVGNAEEIANAIDQWILAFTQDSNEKEKIFHECKSTKMYLKFSELSGIMWRNFLKNNHEIKNKPLEVFKALGEKLRVFIHRNALMELEINQIKKERDDLKKKKS